VLAVAPSSVRLKSVVAIAVVVAIAGCGSHAPLVASASTTAPPASASASAAAPPASASPSAAAPSASASTAAAPRVECGARPQRAPTHDGYPVRYPIVDEATQLRLAARFRAENAGPWESVTFDRLGSVERATGPSETLLAGGNGAASTAASFFLRNASFFGLTPAHRPILEACAHPSGDTVYFEQFWGPYRVAVLVVSAHWISGHFVGALGPPPNELDDAALVAPFVGRGGVVTSTTQEHYRPCDPGPRGSCPSGQSPPPRTTARPHTLRARDLRVEREVGGYVASTDARIAELRIVATVRVRLNGISTVGPGSGWSSTETRSSFAFEPGEPGPSVTVDAVTGESLDGRTTVRF